MAPPAELINKAISVVCVRDLGKPAVAVREATAYGRRNHQGRGARRGGKAAIYDVTVDVIARP